MSFTDAMTYVTDHYDVGMTAEDLYDALEKYIAITDAKIAEMSAKIEELTARIEALENPTPPDEDGVEGE